MKRNSDAPEFHNAVNSALVMCLMASCFIDLDNILSHTIYVMRESTVGKQIASVYFLS